MSVDGDGMESAAALGVRLKKPLRAPSSSVKRFMWAQEIETDLGVEIRCTVCNKVFMKPNRKRKHDATAFERHEETEKHVKAAGGIAVDDTRTTPVDMSIQGLVTDEIQSTAFADHTHQETAPSSMAFATPPSTQAPPLLQKSTSDATWECFLQLVLLPSTLHGLGHDGVRKMVSHFKMAKHRQSLQALIALSTRNPDLVPSVVNNVPNPAKFLQLYLQLTDLGLFDE